MKAAEPRIPDGPPNSPRYQEALRFLQALTGERDPRVTFQTFDDTGAKRPALAKIFHGTLAQFWTTLNALNSDRAGIFVTVNETDLRGRKTENVKALRAIFVDSDSGEFPDLPPQAPTPSIVVKTAHGYHAYWRLKPGEPLDAFKPAQLALARRFHTDKSVTGLPWVLRVPGFMHHKGDPVPIELVSAKGCDAPVYSVDEVLKGCRATLAPTANEPLPPATVTAPLSLPYLVHELAKTVVALPVVAEAIREHGTLTYREWICGIAMPLQGTFGDTPLFPIARDLFAKLTKELPGYEPGDERKLDDFTRTAGTRRTMASVYALADRLSPSWRENVPAGAADDAAGDLPEVLRSGDEAFDSELPPVEYVIQPYLPRGEVVEIHGPHGRFKSTLALYATLAVACGTSWGEAAVTPGRTVFISLEDRNHVLERRVRAFNAGPLFEDHADDEKQRDQREQLIRENFKYLGREGARTLILTKNVYNNVEVRRDVVERLIMLCEGASLVVIETGARVNPGGESNEALQVLAAALEEVATRTEACVILVRHVPKDHARSEKVDSYGGRGGGSFADAARGVLSIARDGNANDAPVRLVHTKSYALGPHGPDLAWRPVPGANGMVFLETMTASQQQAAKNSSEDDRLLARLRAKPDGATWRELEKGIRSGPEHDTRREQLKAALDRLVARGAVAAKPEQRGKSGPTPIVYRAKDASAGRSTSNGQVVL